MWGMWETREDCHGDPMAEERTPICELSAI